ncbi:glycosyltransferase family 10 domain-containing protein [uncultured Helicobacter sp.]|uniref:glycosyltransferase family 10 domain-containing protein n=1 Tax=uncultured Helicobacter sp. TaxID=175537 RepID=UPI003751A278
MKPIVSMRVVDWYLPDTEENFYANMFVRALSRKYDVRYSKNPDFLIYGTFGYEHLQYDCVRIFFTGENLRTNWNVADYGIDFDYMDFGDRHLRLPYAFILDKHLKDVCEASRTRILSPMIAEREKFCAFMATNGGGEHTKVRDRFFELLGAYKRVDSGGQWNNNIGGAIGDRYNDFQSTKRKWLQQYRFHICFENSSYPGYLTEKLFDAYAAGCIPIYWGDTSLRCAPPAPLPTSAHTEPQDSDVIDTQIPHISAHLLEYGINPKAFINAHNFPSLQDLVQEVKRIDNDEKAYKEMYLQPLFLDDFNPYEYYEKKLEMFLDSIVSQDSKTALRRGDGTHIRRHYRILLKGSDPLQALRSNIKREVSKIFKRHT